MTRIWIDALEFDSFGGWSPETQFAHEMGQGYLMSIDQPGIAVEDAVTAFTVACEGMYRVWVRTKNWLKDDAPGRFRVQVDDKRLPREMGKQPTTRWYWDIAGDIRLAPGRHELRVQDTSGWFGRFAAVIITDDMDFTPSPEVGYLLRQRREMKGLPETPERVGAFDVIVAGGGPGGVPAAVAAARRGMRVALLQSRPVLGGNGSEEAGVCFCGASFHHMNMREAGIAEEIHRHRSSLYLSWEGALRAITDAEPNLTIYYNQFVTAARVESGRIREVDTLDVVTNQVRTYEGRVFIDCTGDGWLGYYAGAAYRLGREARWQYGESLAPETPDQETMSGCLMGPNRNARHCVSYSAVDTGAPVPFTAPRWAVKLPEQLHRAPRPAAFDHGEWWIENPTDLDDLWDQEAIRDELLRLSLGYFHWLKNDFEGRDLVKNYQIVGFPRYNAKRENRRLIGDAVLTQDDCLQGRVPQDVIAYAGWPLDVHHPRGIYSGKEGPYFSNNPVPLIGIPFRCLYSKNIDNLLMAGRCASVSHMALGSTRVQNTIATMGQAAGTAAALCVRMKRTPRQLGQDHITVLQRALMRDDQYIPWLCAPDPDDLAPLARVSATSESRSERFSMAAGFELDWDLIDKEKNDRVQYDAFKGQNWVELDVRRACFVLRGAKPTFIQLKLKNATDAEIVAHAALTTDLSHLMPLAETELRVPARFEGWMSVPLPLNGVDKPAFGVVLDAVKGLYWHSFDYCYPDMCRYARIDAWNWYVDSFNALSMNWSSEEPPLCNCAPDHVTRGTPRFMSPERGGWVSDPNAPLPQTLQLSWNQPVTFDCVQLTFDTDMLNPPWTMARRPIVPKTVRDYTVEALLNGRWTALCDVRGNYLRHRVHRFSPVCADGLRVVVRATHGDPSARIFELRVYCDSSPAEAGT